MTDDEIICEGSLQTLHKWIPITCTIIPDKETEKAIHGTITVTEDGEGTPLYEPIINWIPKSMSENPWFICTKIFDEERKVANKRFESYDDSNYSTDKNSKFGYDDWDNNYDG